MKQNFEAERRFLVENLPQDILKSPALEIVEGYLNADGARVRVVLRSEQSVTDEITVDQIATGSVGMTIRRPQSGIMLDEDHQVSPQLALSLLDDCGSNIIRKKRYDYDFDGALWVVNVYREKFAGLKIADVSAQPDRIDRIKLPAFVRREITTELALCDQSLSRIENLETLWSLIYGYFQTSYRPRR